MVCKKLNVKGLICAITTNRMVWGDGEHHSTAFMLDAITRYSVEDKTILDIGTGTGILSVLCGKLGAKNILAVDIDPNALEVAKRNFKENNVEVETKQNNLTSSLNTKFDVVLANLQSTVQIENIKNVGDVLKDDGLLIMTWFNLFPFEEMVKGFEVLEHVPLEEYDGYVLRKEK